MGDFIQVLEVVHKHLHTLTVVIEKKNSDSLVTDYCKRNLIPYEIVETEGDVNELVTENYFENVIVASFGIILSEEFLKRCRRVFNFHPGDVYTCRGRHPLPAAIKRGDSKVAISVHQIDSQEIDKGKLFSQYFIALDYEKSYHDNSARLLRGLTILAEDLCTYLTLNELPPLWEWTPHDKSYLKKLEATEFDRLLTVKQIKEF